MSNGMLARLSDAVDAARNPNIISTDPFDEIIELVAAVDEFLASTRIEQLRDVLRDENGLAPTEARTDVLIAVVFEMNRTDENWEFPGGPSARDYAADAIRFLETRYGSQWTK